MQSNQEFQGFQTHKNKRKEDEQTLVQKDANNAQIGVEKPSPLGKKRLQMSPQFWKDGPIIPPRQRRLKCSQPKGVHSGALLAVTNCELQPIV